MKTIRKYKKVLIGYNDNRPIYLSPPSWDCGWYWGFGYLGNRDCHYHVNGLGKDKNLYDGFKEHFGDSLKIRESNLWAFAELFKSFYVFKEMAEVYGRGGCHLTTNPCKEIITNKQEAEKINNEILPAIFDEIYKILDKNHDNDKIDKDLVELNLKGDTMKVVEFMNLNNIKTDDLKNINGLTKDDYYNIHGYWWTDYHAKRKESK